MAGEVVEDEFEFDERAVEGGILDLFFFACVPFGLLSGKWQLSFAQ